ncbi:MAG: hypothetical protein ACL7BU_03520 [Candidatus Phlomobacter fragariae]
MNKNTSLLFDSKLIHQTLFDAIKKCAPQIQWRNPIIFIVYIGSILTTLIWFYQLFTPSADDNELFTGIITVWLWFTVLCHITHSWLTLYWLVNTDCFRY